MLNETSIHKEARGNGGTTPHILSTPVSGQRLDRAIRTGKWVRQPKCSGELKILCYWLESRRDSPVPSKHKYSDYLY